MVYIACRKGYIGVDQILGIYSSYELAEKRINKCCNFRFNNSINGSWDLETYKKEYYTIIETKLDGDIHGRR